MFITRVAPSPTGVNVHLGTMRQAYHNWLAARASNGKFILRVDDTDISRNNTDCLNAIFNTMKWLGLDYDELHYQSDRKDLHLSDANLLVKNGYATVLDNGAIALKWCDWMPRSWQDDISGNIAITDDSIQKMDNKLILIKGGDQLGQPTYHLSSVSDDIDMGINWIIRGHDHLANTPRQVALFSAILKAKGKGDLPKFSHVGLIHKNKKKMSKRDNDPTVNMQHYIDNGYDPDAVLNFILRLGWSVKGSEDIPVIDRDLAIKLFLNDGKLSASPANFDIIKLNSFDRKYKGRKGINVKRSEY